MLREYYTDIYATLMPIIDGEAVESRFGIVLSYPFHYEKSEFQSLKEMKKVKKKFLKMMDMKKFLERYKDVNDFMFQYMVVDKAYNEFKGDKLGGTSRSRNPITSPISRSELSI